MRGRPILVVTTACLALAAVVGWGPTSAVQPLPQSFCSPVYYGGAGSPRSLIVSDFPMQGLLRAASERFTAAIRFILARHHFKAGKYSLGYQACDDANPETQSGDPTICASNAKAYAADLSVLGVIGTWSSRCARIEIPVLNGAPRGPLALVSPTNTGPGLTHAAAGTDPGEPGRYYPTGRRNFVRLIAPDDFLGAGEALLASDLRLRRVFVLDDKEGYGLNVAGGFRTAARHLHVRIVGTGEWDRDATEFSDIAGAVRRSRADGVFLGGYATPNSGELLRELRVALGSKGVIIAPDGFTPLADLIASFGRSATEGIYVAVPGLVRPKLGALARHIVKQFGQGRPGSGGPLDAAQAADVLLNAIAHSNGSRASTTRSLFRLRIVNGILGSFRFDRNGDTTLDQITVFRARHGRAIFDREIAVPHHLVP